MFAYIARQPILDKDKNVCAYELLFRDGKNNCFPDIQQDEATSRILANNHLTLGLEDIACNKTSFINFNRDTLLNDFPSMLNPESVVVEIVETTPTSDEMVAACKKIKDEGFKLALDDYGFDSRWDVLLPYIDYIKVDTQLSDYNTIARGIEQFDRDKVTLLAGKVETLETFHQVNDLGFDLFQGFFFAQPEVIKQKNLPTSKLALIELMKESANEAFSFDRVNAILERDVGMSYMLLRFINNPMVNKRHEITSLRHALNYMGEIELKKFISILALAKLGDDQPIELLHMSLVRAKFCELLSMTRKDKDNPPKGFLVGLFSLLDALLSQNLADLVNKLPIDVEIRQALIGQEGRLNNYLAVAKSFESANWLNLIRLSKVLQVDQKTLHSLFNQAIVWGNGIRTTVSQHYPMSRSVRV